MLKKKSPFPILDDFFLAVSFLTIIPLTVAVSDRKNALASAMLFFPAVGLGIAALSLGLVALLEPFFPERFLNLLLVLFPIVLSGGLHVDGLADFFDGFFQGKTREDILAVMKDPRVGVWGALSVVFLVLIKWELLMMAPFKEKIFLFAVTLSRWSFVVLSYLHPPARKEGGLGETVARKTGLRELGGASLCAFAVALLLGWRGFCVGAGVLVFVLAAGHFYRRKIGGITGDTIGATGEMSEVVAYLLFIVITKA